MDTQVLPREPVPVRLMNTIWADRKGIHDALADVDDLRSWLTAVDGAAIQLPAGARLGRSELAAFRVLRDALRRLAALVTEDARPAAAASDIELAVTKVNEAVASGNTWPQLSLRRGNFERQSAGSATPAMRSLSTIATEAIELFAGEDRALLRACYAPGCVLYFVKNHPRRDWCSTSCGNRARAARHYRRHHGAES
ncbi:CGNR zinc finger protein [Kribbella sp. VKM Ac-2527]|uniref:CGNR zinc finger protein n=1 Tax=Kribbella caucasensis TaxID=2512215 RepID=A0A4R6KMK1_9ACTN|nr:CGNR zinc finger domain-containing protein [Kribbella sp. VKM Ac-2527]TDO51270.1 CGNR zinc finger protein [Kribbella sp. VKM Ac-2527]